MNITVTNRKGGVGKTTVAVHLAAALATLGYRVGLIDTDSQGHCSVLLNMHPENDLYDVLINNVSLNERVVVIPERDYSTESYPSTGKLFLLKGHDATYKIPREMEDTDIFNFLDMVTRFKEAAQLDLVIIDTSPTLSQFDGAVYLATDAFLYVTEPEMLSISGLIDAIKNMQSFAKMRKRYVHKETRILGIIPNRVRPNTLVSQNSIGALEQEFGIFDEGGLMLPYVRLTTMWSQAANERMPMFVFEPDSAAAGDMWTVVDKLRGRINTWQKEKVN